MQRKKEDQKTLTYNGYMLDIAREKMEKNPEILLNLISNLCSH